MTKEIWLPIPSQPLLEASSLGRIRSKKYSVKMPHGGSRSYQMKATYGRVTKAKPSATHEYKIITFRRMTKKVAPLICEAFHGPKPYPKAVCIHKDENSFNNQPSNLKWGSQKENLNMPLARKHNSQSKLGTLSA